MSIARHSAKADTLNLRIGAKLKAEFVNAAEAEHRHVSEVLRELMSAYVQRQKRMEFEADARRQSKVIASAAGNEDISPWLQETWNMKGWQ